MIRAQIARIREVEARFGQLPRLDLSSLPPDDGSDAWADRCRIVIVEHAAKLLAWAEARDGATSAHRTGLAKLGAQLDALRRAVRAA